jgi:hypothetical protein
VARPHIARLEGSGTATAELSVKLPPSPVPVVPPIVETLILSVL